jgi:hypothetical protein
VGGVWRFQGPAPQGLSLVTLTTWRTLRRVCPLRGQTRCQGSSGFPARAMSAVPHRELWQALRIQACH